MEILAKFRSRRADIQISHRFRSLYGSVRTLFFFFSYILLRKIVQLTIPLQFLQDRHWVSLNPLAVYNTLGSNPGVDDLKRAHKFWVEHETRRRVLEAAFLLDIQQSTLFEQPLSLLQNNTGGSSGSKGGLGIMELPFPCQSDLWESETMEEWGHWASMERRSTLSSVAEEALGTMDTGLPDMDTFQACLVLCHIYFTRMNSPDLESTLHRYITALAKTVNREGSTSHVYSRALFSYHTLLAARNTPLVSLLTVSGESWLFNRKLPQQSEFRAAKEKLRAWAPDTEAARKAVWHAVRALEFAFIYPETSTNSPLSNFENLCLQPFPTAATNNPLSMLHTNWTLYTSSLICWAYGFDSTSLNHHTPQTQPTYPSAYQQQNQPRSALSYIKTLISIAPTWQHLSHETVPGHIRCCTGPLLEFVRETRMGQGKMGGLLNEGERVLTRLCGTETREMLEF